MIVIPLNINSTEIGSSLLKQYYDTLHLIQQYVFPTLDNDKSYIVNKIHYILPQKAEIICIQGSAFFSKLSNGKKKKKLGGKFLFKYFWYNQQENILAPKTPQHNTALKKKKNEALLSISSFSSQQPDFIKNTKHFNTIILISDNFLFLS